MTAGEHELVLAGGTVVTCDDTRRVLVRGWVAVDAGRIAAVGTGSPPPSRKQVDCSGDLVLPGFVNAHAHLLGAFVRGLGGDRTTTIGASADRTTIRIRRALVDEAAVYAAVRLAIVEMQLSGITTTTDSQPGLRGLEAQADGTLRALTESGIRAVFFRSSVDRTDFVPREHHDDGRLAASEHDRLAERWGSDQITIGMEAMALHRVSDDLLAALSRSAGAARVPFGIHGPYDPSAARHPMERWGLTAVEALERFGLLDDRTLLYHPVVVTEQDIELLASSDAGAAACPVDNMLIGTETLPMDGLLEAGVRLGLGLDQPNDGHDMMQLMKVTLLQQRARLRSHWGSPETAIELATVGGARALHLESEIGSIEVGKAADLVVFDGRHPTMNPSAAALSNVVLAASPQAVRSVFVNGERVVEGGRHLRWDMDEVVAGARSAMARALGRAIVPGGLRTTWPVETGA